MKNEGAEEDRRRYVPAPDVLFEPLGEESVLLQVDRELYFGLNAVGTRVWQLIPELACAEAIRAQLAREYEIDATTLAADVQRILAELRAAELVVPAGDDAPPP